MMTSLRVVSASIILLLSWLHLCGAPTAARDFDVLMSLYHLTNGTNWREGFTWEKGVVKGYDPCDKAEFFKGLACSGTDNDPDRRVTNLWLSATFLTGPIPEDIGALDMLQELYMTGNNISGIIPPSICNMTKLTVMDLGHNNLTGVIPDCIGDMARLQKVDLRSNELEGTVPAGFGLLSELQGLYLSDNRLHGTLPRELFDAKRVEVMFLSYNELSGTVPKIWARYKIKETPSMQGLSWLDTRANKLEGTYPNMVALLGAV